jgi:hypothetical protein
MEQTAHANKERLKERVLANSAGLGSPLPAETLNQWSQEQAEAIVERLQASE